MQTTRTITVSENLTFTKTKKLTKKPKINLTGKWLADAGFEPGKKIHITVTQKSLTIIQDEETN